MGCSGAAEGSKTVVKVFQLTGYMAYQFYRKTTLGNCLSDALDELYQNNYINSAIVTEVLNQFDRAMCKVLAHNVRTKLAVKGDLHTYRFCDNVWTFILHDAEFTDSAEVHVNVNKIKIVACDAKSPSAATNSTTSSH